MAVSLGEQTFYGKKARGLPPLAGFPLFLDFLPLRNLGAFSFSIIPASYPAAKQLSTNPGILFQRSAQVFAEKAVGRYEKAGLSRWFRGRGSSTVRPDAWTGLDRS